MSVGLHQGPLGQAASDGVAGPPLVDSHSSRTVDRIDPRSLQQPIEVEPVRSADRCWST
jgi:hypothetical protein